MSTSLHEPFFASPENLDALRLYSRTLKSYASSSETGPIADALVNVIDLMISNAARFDEYCTVNIEWIGINFMSVVREFPNLTTDKRANAISAAFASAFRFLCELEFTQPSDPSSAVSNIGRFVDENLDLFTGYDRQQINFARYSMPAQVAKKLLNDPAIAEFQKFSQTVAEAQQLKKNWDSELDERKQHLESIQTGLKNATSTYNFVGLVNGFRHMVGAKRKERVVAFCSLIVLAALMVTPPVIQISYILLHIEVMEIKREILLYTLPTVIAIEIILVYFFRVVLVQFRSVKAQVLQLDLRIALCQFVQSYAEYAMTIKKHDPNALSKFESIVFSGLAPDNEGIPSTFDGAEQLASLIRSLRAA